MSSINIYPVSGLAGSYPFTLSSVYVSRQCNLASGRFLSSNFKSLRPMYARSGCITRAPLRRKLSVAQTGQLVKVSKDCVVSKFRAVPKVGGRVLLLVGVHQLIADPIRPPVCSDIFGETATAIVQYMPVYKPDSQRCGTSKRTESLAPLRSLFSLAIFPVGAHIATGANACMAIVLRTPRHVMKIRGSSQRSATISRALISRPRLDVAIIDPEENTVARSSKAVILRGARAVVLSKLRTTTTRLTSRSMLLICAAPVLTAGVEEIWTAACALVFLQAVHSEYGVFPATGTTRAVDFSIPNTYTMKLLKASSEDTTVRELVVRDASFSRTVAREHILFLCKASSVSLPWSIALPAIYPPARRIWSSSFRCAVIIALKVLGQRTTITPMPVTSSETTAIEEPIELALVHSTPAQLNVKAPSFVLGKKSAVAPAGTSLRPTMHPFIPPSAACKENRKSLNSRAPPFTPPKSTLLRTPQMGLDKKAAPFAPIGPKGNIMGGVAGVSKPSIRNAVIQPFTPQTPLRNAHRVLNVGVPSARPTKAMYYKIRSPNEYTPLFEPPPPGSRPASVGVNTPWFTPSRTDTPTPSRAVTIRAPVDRKRRI